MTSASAPPSKPIEIDAVLAAAHRAARAVPPAWSLAATVAVNPFLGQADETLAVAAARLERVAGAPVAPPRALQAQRLRSGAVTDIDLLAALHAAPSTHRPADLAALKAAIGAPTAASRALPTVADLAAEASGIDWPALILERFGAWAAGWCDAGQAPWQAPRGRGAYAAWRAQACHDLTPEIIGLDGFALHVSEAPESAAGVLARAAARLGLGPLACESYFHRLLMSLGGWAHYARGLQFQSERAGGTDDSLTDFLAIRLVWDEALWLKYQGALDGAWTQAVEAHALPVQPGPEHAIDAILQAAAERAAQRRLAQTLDAPTSTGVWRADWRGPPTLQAAFCIDVRSEVFRRALESLDPGIATLGFAGFFGVGAAHRRFASDVVEHRLPVLLNPAVTSVAGGEALAGQDRAARSKARASRAWGRFKAAAVASFAFVEATGPVHLGRLVLDALGLHGPNADADPAPRLDPNLSLADRIAAAGRVLRAMSLTEGFARLVLLVGHGAGVVNNPHASALHCGACGGHSGEVNARLLAGLLNDAEVRAGLGAEGLVIPADTLFVAGLHDTTADAVRLYDRDPVSPDHAGDLKRARAWLDAAAALARAERALNLPGAVDQRAVLKRGRDWSQVRPEWGLAGCQAFIAAPRRRTQGRDLAGRAFLHDYDWRADSGFSVLELILTAPVVVASWISLQYYGSAVAPEVFGGGDKLLHNVVGGIGVFEGGGGALRVGLPWQSVHDGERLMHDPLRLTVCVEAPREAISDILARHDHVRALFDNGWMSLFALDDAGRMAWRYAGGLDWTAEPAAATDLADHGARGVALRAA